MTAWDAEPPRSPIREALHRNRLALRIFLAWIALIVYGTAVTAYLSAG